MKNNLDIMSDNYDGGDDHDKCADNGDWRKVMTKIITMNGSHGRKTMKMPQENVPYCTYNNPSKMLKRIMSMTNTWTRPQQPK